MKENVLREMIRKQIKSSLKEAPVSATARVGSTLDRVEKMAGVKMLKKALGAGTPQQQASGLLAVVKAISGDSPQTAKMLARMLMKGEPSAAPEASVEENRALGTRMGKLDATQQMKMLKQALSTKSASDQSNFILDLLKGFDLKKAAKNRLFLQMRKELKN
mgnify:CR=1 FL=1